MDLGIEDKRALVTGSTAGIGGATARALAAEGAEVVINGRSEARVTAALEALRREVPAARVSGMVADLGNAEGCAVLIARVATVDILVNNLGIFEPKPFTDISDADWLRFFEINVMSGVRLARHYVQDMRARGWGRIVFVSSESGVQIPAEMIHYGVTKTAQLAVARGLAETLQGTGVTVNSVLPGPTTSEGVGAFVEQLAASRGVDVATVEREFFATARPSSIIRRFSTPAEVAAMITYVCSAQASATTGAALRVDGGVVRAIASLHRAFLGACTSARNCGARHTREDHAGAAVEIARLAMAVVITRVGQHGGALRSLLCARCRRADAEVVSSRGCGADHAVAPLDDVEINLEDAPLVHHLFLQRSNVGLFRLAQDIAVAGEKEIFGELLADGRAARDAAAAPPILFESDLHAVPIV